MNRDALTAKVANLLDAEAANHKDGIKSAELSTAIHGDVVALLADLERDLQGEAEALIREVSAATRKSRRASMDKTLDYLLDAFEQNDESAYVDPLMQIAFPLGTSDGMVKALKFWTEDDWTGSVLAAYDNAAMVTASAQAHAELVAKAKRLMKLRGVEMFGAKK